MRIALVHDALFPVQTYGGTERVVWWLAKGLSERGVDVVLVCKPGSKCPYARVVTADFSRPIENQIEDIDLFHYFDTLERKPESPYVVTIGGNGKPGQTYLPNTIFVSQNHAQRHQSDSFIHHGLDPQDYIFQTQKKSHLLFLAKTSWKVKNVENAVQIAQAANQPLRIVGGKKWLFSKRGQVRWLGMLGGPDKAGEIAQAKALIFPIIWNEPFGLAVIESLISGTPVIATRRGSMPELLHPDVGVLCEHFSDFVNAVASMRSISAKRCRDFAMEHFHYLTMCQNYQIQYERVLNGHLLNLEVPISTEDPEHLYPLGLPPARLNWATSSEKSIGNGNDSPSSA